MKVFFIVQDKNTRSRIKRLQAVRFFSLSNIIFLFRKKDRKKISACRFTARFTSKLPKLKTN